jgi:hypothetical protein
VHVKVHRQALAFIAVATCTGSQLGIHVQLSMALSP